MRSDFENEYLYIRSPNASPPTRQPLPPPTPKTTDPYYTDCRLKNPNTEYMTDEQIEELVQSDDEDFNNTRPDSDFLIINGAFQDQQIFMKE